MENQLGKRVRIWELDFLRGIALIFMVYFHLIYDLHEFYNLPVQYEIGLNYYIGKISAIMFMFISGISSSLSRSNVKRGLKVFALAMTITIATYIFDPLYYVKFGILHFLGISMLLSSVFSKFNKYVLLLAGSGIIILGIFISEINAPFNFLFPLGLRSNTFMSSDYYPLIPWFGVFLLGMSMQKFFYTKKQSILPFELSENNLISKSGRHTLWIYLVHQPAIIVVLYVLSMLNIV